MKLEERAGKKRRLVCLFPEFTYKKSEVIDLALKGIDGTEAYFFLVSLASSFFQVRLGALVTRPFLRALAATRM